MFNTSKNVPVIYPEKSRDFQLLSVLVDLFVNSTRGNTSKMSLQLSSQFCDERLLPLLAIRKGFFTNEYLPSKVQKSILSVFSIIRKSKGSQASIELAARAALKDYPYVSSVTVSVNNEDKHTVLITCSCSEWFDIDERYIREVMKYTLPTGYLLQLDQKVGNIAKTIYITL